MKEQYVNNINTHKEVLNALPKNNEKNIKAYKNKVRSDMLRDRMRQLERKADENFWTSEEIEKKSLPYLAQIIHQESSKENSTK